MSIAGDEWTNKTLSQRLNDAGVFPSAQGGSNLTLSPQHYKLLCPQGRKILLFPALNTPESGISMAGDEWDNGDLGPYEEVSLAEAGVDIHLIPPRITPSMQPSVPRPFDLPGVVLWNYTDRVIWDDGEEGWVDYNE